MAFKTNPMLLAAAAAAFSLQALGADFSEVYQLALKADSTFAEAQARHAAASEKLPQGRAGLLPNVVLTANTTANNNQVESGSIPRTDNWRYNSNGYTFSATQPLFRSQNWASYEQSKLVVAQAEIALSQARQDLVLRTAQAYFDILQAKENLAAAQAYKLSVSAQLQIATSAFDLGTGIKTDVFDAQTRHEMASSEVIASEGNLEMKQRALETIIGVVSPSLASKRREAKVGAPDPVDLAKWIQSAEQQNLAVMQQHLAAEIASKEIERQRAAHYPTLDLVASKGRSSTLNSGTPQVTDGDSIGLQLTVPLFQGGETSSRIVEAAANRRAALAAQETARRSAVLATRQAYVGVVNGLAQIRTMEAANAAAQQALKSNRDAFGAGVRLGLDVLNAENQAYATHRELSRVTVETLMAHLRLKAAVGALGSDDVTAINSLLE